MARCEEGYRCAVCGEEVERLIESELYLRFVIGELDPEKLHTASERHLRCNPALAQFIEHADFDRVELEGPFGLANLDADFVAQRRQLVSEGFARLVELEQKGGDRDITGYPLAEALRKYGG